MKLKNQYSSGLIMLGIFVIVALLVTAPLLPGIAAENSLSHSRSINENPNNLTIPKIFMLVLLIFIVGLFFWEPLPLCVLALMIPALLIVFRKWTGLTTGEALSGFSSEATITILCMFILSEGIRRSGFIQIIGYKISEFSGDDITRQLISIVGLSGPTAGIINNTPVVAIFIPMVSNLARRVKTSPSYLMIPLSYASMMGGTLTLIGSSTNLLASDISARLLNHPISFFEFTGIGLVILITGSLYLILVGPYLIPERIDPDKDLAQEYEMGEFMMEVRLEEDCDLVGLNVAEAIEKFDFEFDMVQIIREEERFVEPLQVKTLRNEDRLIVRAEPDPLLSLLEIDGVTLWSGSRVSEEKLEETSKAKGQTVVETVIPSGSFLEGQSLRDVNFSERYDATIMAVRRGGGTDSHRTK